MRQSTHCFVPLPFPIRSERQRDFFVDALDRKVITMSNNLKTETKADLSLTVGDLRVFDFDGHNVRVIMKDGSPWWVLKDACDVLGLGSPHKVAERLDEDEKGRNQIPTPGGKQEITVINESGLYNVILRSDKPEAKRFKKWVTGEVLPR